MSTAGVTALVSGAIGALDWKLRDPPPDLARRYLAERWWDDRSLGEVLVGGLAAHPELAFVTRSAVHAWRGTFAEVLDGAQQVAGWLRAAGVGPGDVVAFQLPNWVEAAITFYATCLTGATVAPIVHFYGRKEVDYILRQSGARVLVTADRFGRIDYLSVLEEIRGGLPELELVVVVAGEPSQLGPLPPGFVPWSIVIDGAAGHLDTPALVDPTAPALVAYTSGTTADPKGVVHSHRSIGAEIRQLGGMQPADTPPMLTGAPVGHGIGMLAALLLPVARGGAVHLIDVWEPGAVLRAMVAEGLTSGAGATYFLTSLLDHPDFRSAVHVPLMPRIGLGGAPVPHAVGLRAAELGISIVRSYGSTEHPSITGNTHEAPLEKRIATDGCPLAGCEMRLLDDYGREVELGEPGEIWSRGPDCFMGYTDAALTAAAFDGEGWYRTEDVGVLDADGYLTITDRKKDIIIRGGENVSAAEVEELLARMPGVAEVAVVAAPDPRLGEHACAFIRARPGSGSPPTLAAVRERLAADGLARQKWPEELRIVEDFPRTASGKIQKFVLRQRARERTPGGGGGGLA